MERKHAYTCGNYRNRARNNYSCTTHYIRKTVIKELVLADLQRVFFYVRKHERGFIQKATEYGDTEVKKLLEHKRRELDRSKLRTQELDTLFRKLYEDNALGCITDQQFVMLISGYEDEKKMLEAKSIELKKEVNTVVERRTDVGRFVKVVHKHTDIKELDYENVHEFIDRILIHEPDLETDTRKVEIFYNFVGQIDSGNEKIENISYIRREKRNVKSIVI